MTLDRAVRLLAQPKRAGKRGQAARTVLRQIGAHPASGAQVQVLAGRYGPYVTDGKTNASLPKAADPAKLTMEEAVELLKAREGVGPKKGGRAALPAAAARARPPRERKSRRQDNAAG